MKLFLLFSLVFLAYAEVPDCSNGIIKVDHTKTRVVFPSDGNLQIFPDNYVCQLQIPVPFGCFASLKIDVNSANPGKNAPVQVIDQTNQTENVFHAESEQFYLISKGGSINLSTGDSKTQFRVIINWEQYPPTSPFNYHNIQTTNMFDLYFDTPIVYSQSDAEIVTYIAHTTDSKALQDLRGLIFFNGPDCNSTILGTGRQLLDRKTQFVTSASYNHYLTVLFLGKDGSTNTRFMIGLYETTKDFVELQTVIYPETWTGQLSMDASNGKSLIQTWAQGFQGHSMTHGVLNITGTGNLEVYANQSLPNLANPIVFYDASNTMNQLPQQLYGDGSYYLLTGGKSTITLSNVHTLLEKTSDFGRTGYFASENFGTPDIEHYFQFGLTGVDSPTPTIFHLDFINVPFKKHDHLKIIVFVNGIQVSHRV
ncbi:hypothetical protein B9Z55_026773 [Caenorhabditis nigoni]|nr:hypothetical protein B9Z55_026773 [Caenorhabditis nigoni]